MTESPARRISRMLTLVPWLAARPGVTLEETAEHFGITRATLEADLWQIILCGVPGYGPDQLVDIDFWDDGTIYVHDAQTLTAPLKLSPEESTAILLGLRVLAQTPGIEGADAVVSAAAKLEAALEMRMELAHVGSDLESEEISRDFMIAIRERRRIDLAYGSAGGHVTSRRFWPQSAVTIDGKNYVTGWCETAESIRTLRVDRVVRGTLTDEIDGAPGIGDADWWGELNAHRATVRVDARRLWSLDEAHAVDVIGESGSMIDATIGFANLEWVVGWVMRHAGSVIVLDPPWVRHAIVSQALHQRDT
jgi:proteasome accessory factor C